MACGSNPSPSSVRLMFTPSASHVSSMVTLRALACFSMLIRASRKRQRPRAGCARAMPAIGRGCGTQRQSALAVRPYGHNPGEQPANRVPQAAATRPACSYLLVRAVHQVGQLPEFLLGRREVIRGIASAKPVQREAHVGQVLANCVVQITRQTTPLVLDRGSTDHRRLGTHARHRSQAKPDHSGHQYPEHDDFPENRGSLRGRQWRVLDHLQIVTLRPNSSIASQRQRSSRCNIRSRAPSLLPMFIPGRRKRVEEHWIACKNQRTRGCCLGV